MTTFPRPASGTIRGIHWSASTNHDQPVADWNYWKAELKAMGIGFVKLLDDGGGSSARMCELLLQEGIIPIVRVYRPQPSGTMLPDAHLTTISVLVRLGVRYFEPCNEPNLKNEWSDSYWTSQTWQERVHAAMNGWLSDSLRIIDVGGLPAFPALAQCAHTMTADAIGSIPFYDEAFRYLKEVASEATNSRFLNGAWLAVHDGVLNHCYKDTPGRWHYDYPYDEICQHDQPGKNILLDDNSLIGHRAPVILLQRHLGITNVPIISTEGGVFMPAGGFQQWDNRYPGYNYEGQAERTVAMFQWLTDNKEPNFYAMCPWLIGNETMGFNNPDWTNSAWYSKDGNRPVVAAMRASKPAEVIPTPTDAQIREACWNKAGAPYNPEAAFQKYCTAHHLGFPVTDEFVVGNQTVQGFSTIILCCKTGDWGNIKEVNW